ncbi:hypothetical protein AVEN_224745-1 [Araneus ventricosus]|uniref:Uncharacterized protein n=1 Tax=Araneus ventricosus TaxID=182803 RepID=A0A4Y2HWC5_ARAVE|nr:hypothetical protein AVEN_224745-1 [Araneus ventricosus]
MSGINRTCVPHLTNSQPTIFNLLIFLLLFSHRNSLVFDVMRNQQKEKHLITFYDFQRGTSQKTHPISQPPSLLWGVTCCFESRNISHIPLKRSWHADLEDGGSYDPSESQTITSARSQKH